MLYKSVIKTTKLMGPYKSALIAAPRLLLRGAAIENAAIAAAVVVFYCGAAIEKGAIKKSHFF